LTILPDYLYRRYARTSGSGKEITFFSVWYELRWGITGCLMLTVSLITMIFYFHPSTDSATLFFRTVPFRAPPLFRTSSLKITSPLATGALKPTLTSATRPDASGRTETVLKNNVALSVEG